MFSEVAKIAQVMQQQGQFQQLTFENTSDIIA